MARVNYSSFDGNAVRKLEPARKESTKRRQKNADNLVRLTEKQLRKARRQSLKPFNIASNILCVAVLFVLSITTVYSQVQLNELTGEINNASQSVSELQSEQIQLEMQVSNSVDATMVESFAQTYLGMDAISSNQITYLSMASKDAGTIYAEEEQGFFEKIANFFGF